jgi:hypothetical protein
MYSRLHDQGCPNSYHRMSVNVSDQCWVLNHASELLTIYTLNIVAPAAMLFL